MGTKSVFYDSIQYVPSNNTVDPSPQFATKLPRTPDSSNFVYSFKNGYYAFFILPFIGNARRYDTVKFNYSQNINGQPTLPTFTDVSDFPNDLTDLGFTSTLEEYIVVVRIQDDFITERYQFAKE